MHLYDILFYGADVNREQLAVNTIRFLAIEGVEKANSGHPGMPMGCAPIAYRLYTKWMKHDPKDPQWLNRDRFILSAGHGSMLLYSTLHLCGYQISMDDLKSFRQWGSITPGHPEAKETPGVETTTGPLGQGFANAVGMAIAREHLAALYNKPGFSVIDHYIYGICSDGDLMEGISHEAASIAGHLSLGSLILFYDNNGITIDGKTSITFTDDTRKRFESYGWQVLKVEDVNNLSQIDEAVSTAQTDPRPTLIITNTHIGFGSPNKQDTSSSHGSPLGAKEIQLTKENLGWHYQDAFTVPDEVREDMVKVQENLQTRRAAWNELYENYQTSHPESAEALSGFLAGKIHDEWKKSLPVYPAGKKIATRKVTGEVLSAIHQHLPLLGGSADLAASNNTYMKGAGDFTRENRAGKNIHFGIREHGMASILNGIALYAPFIPFGATFLVFSDYLRPAIRLASLSKIRPIYVLTHDSIGLGEDGPTHQPIEHLSALRAIPDITVIRPADANEAVVAWEVAFSLNKGPVAIIMSRQDLLVFDRTTLAPVSGLEMGAYVIAEASSAPQLILMASGSEVDTALQTAAILESKGIPTRTVNMASMELFMKQTPEYRESVLPARMKKRVSIEAGTSMGWERFTGSEGINISIERFGASAPAEILFEKYGFTPEAIAEKAATLIDS